ncbi:hypothetical protein BH09BAC6_BH09BAC6_29890 [soil metagenome]|jgi:hypothetical protein
MNRMPFLNWMPFDNILYIGDEPKACLQVIEKFNTRLLEIEMNFSSWFKGRSEKYSTQDKLQHYIQYHFEGGIAIFKFRNADELPAVIRNECLKACNSLAYEQDNYLS